MNRESASKEAQDGHQLKLCSEFLGTERVERGLSLGGPRNGRA
jgi:hypothetical protein